MGNSDANELSVLFELDRYAQLGRLTGGVIHALNNILAIAVGQLDVMILHHASEPLRDDIETVLRGFEEANRFTQSVAEVNAVISGDGPGDPARAISALMFILQRIHRRSAVEVTESLQAGATSVERLDILIQACFHLLTWGFKSATELELEKRQLQISLKEESGTTVVTCTVPEAKLTVDSNAVQSPVTPSPEDWKNYHLWILDRLMAGRGSWKVEAGNTIEIRWFKK